MVGAMENIDLLVLRTLKQWLRDGHRALLVTVTRTWGSSPRPEGSIMAICDSGAVIGSVSGGCIEDDLIRKHSEDPEVWKESFKTLTYGISAEEAHQFGLPCGGTIELVLEYSPAPESLEQLLEALESGHLMRRTVDLIEQSSVLEQLTVPEGVQFDGRRLSNCFGPANRLFIIGAGQMSEYLAVMAKFNGFRVTVCDPREEYWPSWNLPGVEILTIEPEEALAEFRPDYRTAVVALTHDPKLDDLPLLYALNSPAFYIGAIGSRRNSALRRQRMIDYFGETEESLARLRGPIGLYIGSKTPAEIAVSIMAEIISVLHQVKLPDEMNVEQAKIAQEAEILSLTGANRKIKEA